MPKRYQGDKLPNFTVDTNTTTGTTISQIAQGKPILLVVLRNMGCIFTRYDIQEFMNLYEEFEKTGTEIAIVLQSSAEVVNEALVNAELPLQLICDTKQAIYKTLEVKPANPSFLNFFKGYVPREKKKNLVHSMGIRGGKQDGNKRQLPAYFYCDKSRVIEISHYGKHKVDLPSAEEILQNIIDFQTNNP